LHWKKSNTQEWIVGNAVFPQDMLPESFPGPANAFNCNDVDCRNWVNDDLSSNAWSLLLMVVGVIPCMQQCRFCKKAMKWRKPTVNEPGSWFCKTYKDAPKDHPSEHGLSITQNSPFFDSAPEQVYNTNLGLFFRFLYTRFDVNEKHATSVCGIDTKTGWRWRRNALHLFEEVRKQDLILLAETGSPIEFDGAYYAPKWNPSKHQRKPTNWKKNCLFRIVERYWTTKGRHKQITYITESENEKECLQI